MQLFQIDSAKKILTKVVGSTLAAHGFTEPRDLEAWIVNYNKEIFGRDILWITRQDFLNSEQRSDLIGIDSTGNLIVCELKQGTLTESAIIQALGYASEYAKYDRDDLADRLLAHVKKGHISGLTLNTIEDARQAVYAKISGDKSANSEVPINESQVVLLVGEAFSPNVLSIVDYLNNSSDALSYLIECWRYQLFPLAADQFQLAFEQILPPPNIREEIAQKREEIRSRKYARDPKRIAFMGWLISQLNSSNDFEAWRNPGASYYC